ATLAWFLAALVGVVVGILGVALTNAIADGGAWISADSFIWVFVTFYIGATLFIAPVSLVVIFVVRETRIRRPWADAVGGAAAAVVGSVLAEIVAGVALSGHASASFTLVPFALVAGLLAGPVYWWLAGKLRPPYAR
ncbi:MAG TPA: hypothetical protein PLS69_06480, partial [Terricaulis sp.]|nr:hypothetical protein [Terricaulis sp.]